MHIVWPRELQFLVQIYLLERGIEKIRSANDMGNILRVIIDGDGKLVGENLIFSFNDKIAMAGSEVIRLISSQRVVKCDRAVCDPYSGCERFCLRECFVFANARIIFRMAFRSNGNRQRFPTASARIKQAFFC